MKRILLIFCLLIAVVGAFAKGLNFESESWDFGTVAEDGAGVDHTFSFKNTTGKPVVIHNVRTSCGCTSTEYSRKPIAVGEVSTIGVRFEPLYQVGTISKSIYIYSTASKEPQILTMTGVVTPRVRSLREQYPYTMGDAGRIEMLYLTIPGVAKDEMAQSSVAYVNGSDRPIEVEFRPRRENGELRLFYDRGLAAGESTTIEIGYYLDRKIGKEEILRDTLDIYVNDVKSDKSLYIKGVASSLF